MAGFKTFVDLEILTAAELNDYLMEQVIARFASEAARNAALPAPDAGTIAYVTGTGLRMWTGTAWEQIAPGVFYKTTLGADAATVSFTVPAPTRALEVLWSGRTSENFGATGVRMQLNGITTSNYAGNAVQGNGASVTYITSAAATSANIGVVAGSTQATGYFSPGRLLIVSADNPHAGPIQAHCTSSVANATNTSAWVTTSGVVCSVGTTAVTSITLLLAGGFLWRAGSQFIARALA
jgi:hypothetical protein